MTWFWRKPQETYIIAKLTVFIDERYKEIEQDENFYYLKHRTQSGNYCAHTVFYD
jgi:hypothetical protein